MKYTKEQSEVIKRHNSIEDLKVLSEKYGYNWQTLNNIVSRKVHYSKDNKSPKEIARDAMVQELHENTAKSINKDLTVFKDFFKFNLD